jgi:hypothetical protein
LGIREQEAPVRTEAGASPLLIIESIGGKVEDLAALGQSFQVLHLNTVIIAEARPGEGGEWIIGSVEAVVFADQDSTARARCQIVGPREHFARRGLEK